MVSGRRTKNLFDPHQAGPYRLSRSRLESFRRCSRCFYPDRRLGVDQVFGPPFLLNSATDTLLKKEFDIHRSAQTPHPLADRKFDFARSLLGNNREIMALGHDFRRVLELVTGDEVHRQPSARRIIQDQPETCQQMTPSAVFCAERSPDQTTMVFRSWLGTYPCQCRPVHSARCPNDGHRPRRPREQWPVAL